MNLRHLPPIVVLSAVISADGAAQGVRTQADSIRTLSAAANAAQAFVWKWREEWLGNNNWDDGTRKGQKWATAIDEANIPRLGPWTGCMPGTMINPREIKWSEHVILSQTSSYCRRPNWPLVLGWRPPSMSVYMDSALAPSLQDRMYVKRDTLLMKLDAAAKELPGDSWILGQRIRFRLDQAYRRPDATNEALAIARQCRLDAWWCAALTGFVLHHRGEIAAADSAFAVAANQIPAAQRCGWEDVLALVDSAKRTAYADTPCDKRDTFNRTLWWLSDPLWSEPGNERRVEHYARRVSLLLQSTLPKGERFNWSPDKGGDAARQLIVRYGWPSHMFFMGRRTMDSSDAVDHPLITTEYTPGRIHTVPSWEAITKPLLATDEQWSINPPASMRFPALVYDDTGAIVQSMEFRKAQTRAIGWWPVEHMERSRALMVLSDFQFVMLRREEHIDVAIAADRGDSAIARGHYSATLMRSPSPDVLVQLGLQNIEAGPRALVRGVMSAEPTLLSFELQSREATGADARTRFGVTPPSTIAMMKPSEFAVSDPVLIEPPPSGRDLVADPDTALERMLGYTHLKDTKQVGVYWESYGFSNDDTVEVTLRLSRLDRPGAARRVAVALRLAGDSRAATAISWIEPRPRQLTRTTSASRTIQHRAVTLDLRDVSPGTYSLEVSIGMRGQAVVSGQRAFTIE